MNLLGATSEYCQIGDGTIVLTKFRCENYYSLFIKKLVSGPSEVKKLLRTSRLGRLFCEYIR